MGFMRKTYARGLIVLGAAGLVGATATDIALRPEKPEELTEMRQIEGMFFDISGDNIDEPLPQNFVPQMQRYEKIKKGEVITNYIERNHMNPWCALGTYFSIATGFLGLYNILITRDVPVEDKGREGSEQPTPS